MIARCREAGLKAPQFRQDSGQFIQTIPRPSTDVASQNSSFEPMLTPRAGAGTPDVARLLSVLVGEMSRPQLQRALRLKGDEHFRKAYLQPALRAGLIEMTIPDKPRSTRQEYYRTRKAAPKD